MNAIRTLFVITCLFSSQLVFAQAFGSLDTARAAAARQKSQIQAESDWQTDKKLGHVTLAEQLPSSSMCDELNNLSTGQKVFLACWRFKILTVIDADNCLLFADDKTFWLQGTPTKDLVSDQYVRLASLVEVIGTKDYQAVNGSKQTARVLKFCPADEAAEHIKQMDSKEADKLLHSKLTGRWTAKNGKSITGTLLKVSGTKVTVKDLKGQEVEFNLTVLKPNDIKKIKELAKLLE